MQAYPLIAHPAHKPVDVTAVEARISQKHPNWLILRWRIEGANSLILPPLAGKSRANGLWRTTCFELFLKSANSEEYCEFNLSPSEQWNAYDFSGYRENMRERETRREPVLTMRPGGSLSIFDSAIPRTLLPNGPSAMGLSAVIEEEGGSKSYWAIAHSDNEKPDFHHPACFAAVLAAPDAP